MAFEGHIVFWHIFGNSVLSNYADGCLLVDIDKYVSSVCPFSIMAVWLIFAIWQPYLCCNMSRGMIFNTKMNAQETLHIACSGLLETELH